MNKWFGTALYPPIRGIAFAFVNNLKFFVTENNFISDVIPSLQGWGVMQNHLVSLLTAHVISVWILAHVVIAFAWFMGEGNARYVVYSVVKDTLSAFSNKLAFVIYQFLFFIGITTTGFCCLSKWRMQKVWISLQARKRAVINEEFVGTTLYRFGPWFPIFGCIFEKVSPFIFVKIFHCLLKAGLKHSLSKLKASGDWALVPPATVSIKLIHKLNVVVNGPVKGKSKTFCKTFNNSHSDTTTSPSLWQYNVHKVYVVFRRLLHSIDSGFKRF